MSENGYKVKAIQKGYYDAIREPNIKNRAGEDLSVFFIRKKSDFSAIWMEPIGWTPDEQNIDPLFGKEDGTLRTAEEVANIKSDLMDESIRQGRANKIKRDEAVLTEEVAAVTKPSKKRI